MNINKGTYPNCRRLRCDYMTIPAIGLDAFPRICNVKFGTGLGGGSILLKKTRIITSICSECYRALQIDRRTQKSKWLMLIALVSAEYSIFEIQVNQIPVFYEHDRQTNGPSELYWMLFVQINLQQK